MTEKTVKVSLYLGSICMPPYIGYATSAEPKTIQVLAFIRRKAVEKMLKDSNCFYKAVKAIWKKKNMRKVLRMNDDRVICALCKGDGLDKTGKMVNGSPEPVCVRCGGHGTIPKSCINTQSLTTEEERQITNEQILHSKIQT